VLAIVATHHHPDHVGGAEFLARELGVPLWAHPRARSFGVTVDRDLVDGDRLTLAGPAPEEWTVLHTPGHASDHVCLFEPTTRTLVVGDMVASVGTILVAPGDGDMAEYLRQLERLLKLDAKLALPAHGDPILDPPKLLRAYLVHRAMREAWIERSVVQHPDSTLEALVKIAYADTPVEVHPIAQLSLAAHLEKLVAEGRVSMIDGRFRSTEG
jgi:glyoxylase-like metal-dependent hydrolase (beta-lactamase superfamily II)